MTPRDEKTLDDLADYLGCSPSRAVQILITGKAAELALDGSRAADARFQLLMAEALIHAREKHAHCCMAAVAEELGEVAQALLDKPWQEVLKEAAQLAATACRIATEGDPTMASLRAGRGLNGHLP